MVLDGKLEINEAIAYQAYGNEVPVKTPPVPARERFTTKELDKDGETDRAEIKLDITVNKVTTLGPRDFTIVFTDMTRISEQFTPETDKLTLKKTVPVDGAKTIDKLIIHVVKGGDLYYSEVGRVAEAVDENEQKTITLAVDADALRRVSKSSYGFGDGSFVRVAGMGLGYFFARYYDPEIGKWISLDPAKEFSDAYRYTVNPISHLDPNGALDIQLAGTGSASAGITGSKSMSMNINLQGWFDYLASKANNQYVKAWLFLPTIALDALDWAASGFRGVERQPFIANSEVTGIGGGLILGASAGLTAGASVGRLGQYSLALKGSLVEALGPMGSLYVNMQKTNIFGLVVDLPVGIGFTVGGSVGWENGLAIEKTSGTTIDQLPKGQ